MRILLSSVLLILCSFCYSSHFHAYDEDVIQFIDAFNDGDELDNDLQVQMQLIPYGITPPNPKKILQQASYAFDTFRYSKCIEKIKEYEKAAFPPPYDYPSPREKLIILAYKAYSNRFLKRYDSAIRYFDEMIDIIEDKDTEALSKECKFITYFEQAQCYLLKGNKKEFQSRIKKIIDNSIAPPYEYYVKNKFKIHHQPCFHNHELNGYETFVFKEIAPKILGKELFALMEERGETPKIRTVANNNDEEFCRRMCARASYICAILVGCISQKPLAIAATWALGELLVDCENCCNQGWGSKNCCKEIKQTFWQVCQQHLLDDL